MHPVLTWTTNKITRWLMRDGSASATPLCDFQRMSYELRPGDVLLIEGRSRVAEVIKLVTQSPWTHSFIYLGRIHDIHDPAIRETIAAHYQGKPEDQLIIEALLGKGTIVTCLNKYKEDHIRVCRPSGLSPDDTDRVIKFTVEHIGTDYDIRQLLDLFRFLFPWSFLPRRWRSSLFQHNAGSYTKTVCSCLLAEAFNTVDFPVLPFIDRRDDGSLRFFKRNPRLFSPRDFDHSPYFDIIKYPFLGLDDIGIYRKLPWSSRNVQYNDEEHQFVDKIRQQTPPKVDEAIPEPVEIEHKQAAYTENGSNQPGLKVVGFPFQSYSASNNNLSVAAQVAAKIRQIKAKK